MHGEYKVRGGKLVVVDLEVDGDGDDAVFRDAVVSGDFFLEPDDALEDLTDALNGLTASSSVAEIAAAIQAALDRRDGGVELIGFTTEAVGIAARRAVGAAVSWGDLDIEVIGMKTLPPAEHVALDQVLSEELAAGRRGPVLRFWDWNDALVVIG